MRGEVDYDVIVVGAGVVGSATAYTLATRGIRTLLVDQLRLPHDEGSSHGESRITRSAYHLPHYTTMMTEAHSLWRKLERDSGKQILFQNGLLMLAISGDDHVTQATESMQTAGAPHDVITPSQVMQRYAMLSVPDCYSVVYDPQGGLLRADTALLAYWNQFRKCGGILKTSEPVTDVIPGRTVTITTTARSYTCRSVALCLGPWSDKMAAKLGVHIPLKVMQISVYYWPIRDDLDPGDKTSYRSMPCFHWYPQVSPHGRHFYGLPSVTHPNHVKICYHDGPVRSPGDTRTDAADDTKSRDIRDKLTSFVKRHLPGLVPQPAIQETCYYTMAPDLDFTLDVHPNWNNIVIGAGMSGHGFKLAPVIGSILSDLATSRAPRYDITHFKMDRFKSQQKSAKL